MTRTDYGLDISSVALRVNNLDAVTAFYQNTIGLAVLDQSKTLAVLGVGGKPMLELHQDASATYQPHAPGLFHTAFLLPSRADLGAWLEHAVNSGVALDGASDHNVSEAVYLTDPEGNGVEVYADRPDQHWRTPENEVQFKSGRLDAETLLSEARPWTGAPRGTVIGHVHLQVNDVAAADRVFVDQLGLDTITKGARMGFYSAGGYHHHFGANTYQSRGVKRPEGKATGLMRVDLEMDTDADVPAFIEADWGTRFVINKRAAMAA